MFHTRSVATDLGTSQEIQPIRCAFMLRQFGQTRNGYVATYFIILSSTAARYFRNALAKVRNRPVVTRNGLGKSLVLFQKWK